MEKDAQSLVYKHIVKFFLWNVLISLIIIMSYGVYITHPIKNFRGDTLALWIISSIILVPLGLYLNKSIRNKYILKNENKSSSGGVFENFSDINGCTSFAADDLFGLVFVVIAFLFAWFAGIGFAILLVFVEILLNFILDISPKLNSKTWIHTLAEVLVILYGSYFIALSITILFQ